MAINNRSSTASKNVLAFGDLLEYLRRQGFPIGVDHYLRLEKLLESVEDTQTPDHLKTLLCPIFATNHHQQKQFQIAFEAYLSAFDPRYASPSTEIPPQLGIGSKPETEAPNHQS